MSDAQYSVLEFDNPDTDGDGTPDVLDFDDIEEKGYLPDEVITDRKISVPSRNYIARLKNAVDSPDSFIVDLTAGTEYTVEISKGSFYEYPIADSIPNVEIINPQGETLKFLDLGSFDETYDEEAIIDLDHDVIELSVYPPEEPYMICLTFTPATTGSYKINLNHAFADDDEEGDAKTLFVYKELRNDDTDEAGYYKRFKFQDDNGNLSETINMTDIMELRKAYNVTLSKLIKTYMEYVISGDIEWDDQDFVVINEASMESYNQVLSNIKKYYGFFDTDSGNGEATEDEYDTEVSSSAANTNVNTSIPSDLYGIPYEDIFEPGAGFFGITGVKAQGNAVKNFTLPVPKTKNVKAFYTAKFISSQEEREKLSKTAANASVAIGGFGLNAGYSSGSTFKFGLTSTTLVVHYEEAEVKYRYLEDISKYQLTDNAKEVLASGSTKFRNEYGDYFVAGYKYGGTYDAFISITTDTTEQLEEVKKHLALNFSQADKAASADVSNETKDFLKKRNAMVTVEIRTAGIDTDGQASKITTLNTVDDGIGGVASQLEEFRAKLKKSKVSDLMPCYVMLKRHRSLSPVMDQMRKDKDDGRLPIKSEHSKKILKFNRAFMLMQSYYNAIGDLDNTRIDTETRQQLVGEEYDDITAEVQAYGNDFFMESNAKNMAAVQKKIVNLSSRIKALSDRYAFYRLLVGFQAKEKAYNTSVITDKPYGKNGGSIGILSYNVSRAVTSDLNAGKQTIKEIYQWSGREWNIDFDAGQGYIFCHIRIVANNENDDKRTAYYPTIATREPHYFFKSGALRWNEWKFYLQSMRFTRDLYPFLGLD